jgi:hypothetical protein
MREGTSTTALPRLGRYQVLEKLGAGGMGEVFLAHDTQLDRRVALKVLPAHAVNDPDALGRFQREARALAQLAHPGIVQAFDSGTESDKHFLVMEYVEGRSLATLLRDQGQIVPTRAADFACQVARALQHAHSKGLVHRDIKPSNLLVTGEGPLDLGDNDAPLLVRRCTIKGGGRGIHVLGYDPEDPKTPKACRRVLLRDNLIMGTTVGIQVGGLVQQVQVVGNRLVGCSAAGLVINNFTAEAQNVLIANNTMQECVTGLLLWDRKPQGSNVQVRNNLFLECPGADMKFLLSGGASYDGKPGPGPGEGTTVAGVWHVGHNARQAALPANLRGWIPLAEEDVRLTAQDQVNRETKDVHNFLRPTKDAPMALKGAGLKDPTLPSHIGALPPEGTQPWNWDRTWRMPAGSQLLTVTMKESDGGKYRTIKDALKDAEAWTTIRILDAESYPETVSLDNAKKHEGITLDSPQGATLVLTGNGPTLTIKDVPAVRVSGLRFREDEPQQSRSRSFVRVSGNSPDVAFEALKLRARGPVLGIVLHDVRLSAHQGPVVVRSCTVEGGSDGILVISPTMSSGISICDNRITGTVRGIQLEGGLARCQVVGNLVWNCGNFGVQMEDLKEGSEQILIANNTVLRCACGLSLWDNEPHKKYTRGQAEISNNLVAEATAGDMQYILGVQGRPVSLGDGASLVGLWRFVRNHRDRSGTSLKAILPLAPRDVALGRLDIASRDPSHADFLRPSDDSLLGTGSAGESEASLPSYVGGVPPKGAGKPWDWDVTWRSRVRKTSP